MVPKYTLQLQFAEEVAGKTEDDDKHLIHEENEILTMDLDYTMMKRI